MWKASNINTYPTKVKKVECIGDRSTTRAITNGNLQEVGRTVLAKNTFYNDAVVARNLVPDSIKMCYNLVSQKTYQRVCLNC